MSDRGGVAERDRVDQIRAARTDRFRGRDRGGDDGDPAVESGARVSVVELGVVGDGAVHERGVCPIGGAPVKPHRRIAFDGELGFYEVGMRIETRPFGGASEGIEDQELSACSGRSAEATG